jgi:hypothetical protein
VPANNVDLTAVLPVLDDAALPFYAILTTTDHLPPASRPSDVTPLRNLLPGRVPTLGELRKLMSAIDAVRRMAGEKV